MQEQINELCGVGTVWEFKLCAEFEWFFLLLPSSSRLLRIFKLYSPTFVFFSHYRLLKFLSCRKRQISRQFHQKKKTVGMFLNLKKRFICLTRVYFCVYFFEHVSVELCEAIIIAPAVKSEKSSRWRRYIFLTRDSFFYFFLFFSFSFGWRQTRLVPDGCYYYYGRNTVGFYNYSYFFLKKRRLLFIYISPLFFFFTF